MNLFPEKLRKLMIPCEIEVEKSEERQVNKINLNNVISTSEDAFEENISGSTCYEKKNFDALGIEDSSKIYKF